MGRPAYDLRGLSNGKLTAVRRVGRTNAHPIWLCFCSCGGTIRVTSTNFKRTLSCGCIRRRNVGRRRGSKCRTYRSWTAMMHRCYDRENNRYRIYGKLGVRVCRRWHLFTNFLADMGTRPPKRSIDRINPFGNYEPLNCRWATASLQALNRRANFQRSSHSV